jgi:hypothetical protein
MMNPFERPLKEDIYYSPPLADIHRKLDDTFGDLIYQSGDGEMMSLSYVLTR